MSRFAEHFKELGLSFRANDNLADEVDAEMAEHIEQDVERAVRGLLSALVIDTEQDPHTKDTAKRVAKMLVREVFKGRYAPPPAMTEFPNDKNLDELFTVGPMRVRSACSHHLVPVLGECWVGVIPDKRVVGLSKYARMVEWIMARPQIQEEATVQLADELERVLEPRALAVVVKCDHLCMQWRGVRDSASMTTSVMRGLFRENFSARNEFLTAIRGQGYV